ncbi:hypothetical protein UNH65_29960 [Chitinophaga sp. 180180018-2]|nr:hypothetical protein [Chitinophaga sp. 212800010-3]
MYNFPQQPLSLLKNALINYAVTALPQTLAWQVAHASSKQPAILFPCGNTAPSQICVLIKTSWLCVFLHIISWHNPSCPQVQPHEIHLCFTQHTPVYLPTQ